MCNIFNLKLIMPWRTVCSFIGVCAVIASLTLFFALLFAACEDSPSARYTCINGDPARGAPNGPTDVALCATCDDGYILAGAACRKAIYTCANGTASSEQLTVGNEDIERCIRCDETFALSQGECLPTAYTCANGDPIAGQPNVPNTQACARCDDGFVLNSATGRCEGAAYTCDNGIPINGTPVIPDEAACQACLGGFVLEQGACRPAMYTCAHGVAVSDAPTETRDVEQCASCDPTYTLDAITIACRRPDLHLRQWHTQWRKPRRQ